MQDTVEIKKSERGHIHALVFLTIVCFIFLSATAGITYMVLKSTNKEIELQVERNLLSKAHEKVSELSTWYGSVTNRVKILSNSDFLRLFTYEATQNFSDYADMFELSKEQNEDNDLAQSIIEKEITVYNEGEFPVIQAPTENDDKLKLAQQLASININLRNFAVRSNFLSAYIFSTDFKPFASYNDNIIELNEMQKTLMQKAMDKDALVISNAYHANDTELTIDIIEPILSPAYLTEGKVETIGFLLISLDVTFAFNQTSDNDYSDGAISDNGIEYWIIQQSENELIKHNDDEEKHISLPDTWKINSNHQIPFGIRTLDDNQEYYSLGLNVPKLPWLIVTDIPVIVAKNLLYSSTNLILFVIGVSVIAVLLLITFAWWWLVGQEERKSKAKIITLYDTIEKQKTLLENVNSNLQDGIVMENIKGIILYANDAFAQMMQDSMENIIGSNFKNIFIGKTNMPINPYTSEVIRTGIPIKYTEMIKTDNTIHHFRVTYAPYKTKDGEIDGIVGIYSDITDLIMTQNSHQLMSLHLIKVLKRTIEAFDPYLKGHANNTGQLAVILAYMHELNETQVSVIKTAANLSQIGMIQLPYELRSKTSIFSLEERNLMETHVELAKNILDGIEFGLPVQNVIYQMYEKLDGTGYPKHLSGDEICIESRILSVANTFCAIMRPRAHRQAQDIERALQILSLDNKQYDWLIIKHLHIWLKEPEGKNFIERIQSL